MMKVGGTTTQAKGVHIPLANNNNLAIIFYFINSDDALWPSLRAFTTTTLVLLLLLLLLVREAFEVPPPPFCCPSLLHPSTCFSAETKLYFSFLGHTHCRHTRTREQGSPTTDYSISLYANISIKQLLLSNSITYCTFGVTRLKNALLGPSRVSLSCTRAMNFYDRLLIHNCWHRSPFIRAILRRDAAAAAPCG